MSPDRRQERIRALASRLRSELDALGTEELSLGRTPDKRLSALLRQCGFERRGPNALKSIKDGLAAQGITTMPDLEDRTVRSDDRIFFFCGPPGEFGASRWTFRTERELQEFVFANWARLPVPLRGVKLLRTELRLGSSRFDVLGWRARSNQLVLIEFKNGSPGDRVVGQLAKYLRELSRHSVDGFKVRLESEDGRPEERLFRDYSVQGVLITGQGDPAVRRSLEAQIRSEEMPIQWWRYDIGIEFHPIELTPPASGSVVQ